MTKINWLIGRYHISNVEDDLECHRVHGTINQTAEYMKRLMRSEAEPYMDDEPVEGITNKYRIRTQVEEKFNENGAVAALFSEGNEYLVRYFDSFGTLTPGGRWDYDESYFDGEAIAIPEPTPIFLEDLLGEDLETETYNWIITVGSSYVDTVENLNLQRVSGTEAQVKKYLLNLMADDFARFGALETDDGKKYKIISESAVSGQMKFNVYFMTERMESYSMGVGRMYLAAVEPEPEYLGKRREKSNDTHE